MKKSFKLLFVVGLCVFLAGCYGTIVDINIKADGSGSYTGKIGFSETAYQMLESLSEDSDSATELQEMQKFIYNGKTYYGEVITEDFNSIKEFNDSLTRVSEDAEVDSGIFNLSKEADGTLVLTLNVTNETANTTEIETNSASFNISEEEVASLKADMVMKFTFNMPGKVTQVEGDSKGITIKNNKLEIDFLKLDIPADLNGTKRYVFNSKKEEQPVPPAVTTRFTDVPVTLWSYEAINTLAEGGLVSGVGGGRFSPERGMKISEFCQVLANATGMESGADETGYWAAKAIKSCIEKGYIFSHGEITYEIYEDIITREEAISAIQIASGRPKIPGSNITIENIPDGNMIDEKYKELVLQAYNSGITTGVNQQLKFSPKNQLTRGQICQLFCNVNWTTPIKR